MKYTLDLTYVQEAVLSFTLGTAARDLEQKSRTADERGYSKALRESLRRRADEALDLYNAVQTAIGLPGMTADEIVNYP